MSAIPRSSEAVVRVGTSAGERGQQRAAWIVPTMSVLFGVGIAVLLAVAYVYGRDARISAERAELIIVESENRAFCGSLGLAPQTAAYTLCLNGLTAIRRRQDERRNEDAMGML